jgi:microcystin-dependent protein
MTSTFTPNINLEEPAFGDYSNSWNLPNNSNFTITDQISGSTTTVAMSNANVTLTVAQAAYHTINITGTLSANVQLILPSSIGGRRYIWNQTSGSYTITVLNGAGDTGGGLIVGQGLQTPIILTGGRAYYDNYQGVPPGVIQAYAGTTAPPGFLLCVGTSLSTTTYNLLFNAIGYTYGGSSGTFLLPDTRGRLLAGADNMGGSAAGRLTGYSLAVTGGEQVHTLTIPELAAHNHGVVDPGHNHSLNDPGHAHNVPTYQYSGLGGPNILGTSYTGFFGNVGTASAGTGITIGGAVTGVYTVNQGSGAAHNNIQPTIAVNHIIRF